MKFDVINFCYFSKILTNIQNITKIPYNMPKIFVCFFICIMILQACKPPNNTKKEQTTSQKHLFDTDTLLEITLKTHIDSLRKDIGENNTYHQALLFWNNKALKAKVKTRGNFRRDPDNCDFPPLFIQIDAVDAKNTIFEGLQKLVVVTHCQQKDWDFEQMLLEEYAIYKTYALFTNKSLRVRLAKIRYQDTQNPNNYIEKLAFFVENFRDLEKRLQANRLKPIATDTIRYADCNSFLMTQTAVFQFLIGNTDWSVSNQHNIEIMNFDNQKPIAIPYDFDLSGIIDAPYAEPLPALKLQNVRQRLYRGYCQSDAELHLVLDIFKEKQKNIDALWQNLPYYQAKRKQKTKKYIDSFFGLLSNKDSVKLYFLKKCR